jgi:hypothetical protein
VDDDGPWQVKFKVANGSGDPQIFDGRCSDPDAEVVLVERGGQFSVNVKTGHH